MALKIQLMIGEETTWGTAVTPNRAYEVVPGSGLTNDIARIESTAIRSNTRVQRSDDWTPGRKVVSGDIELELTTRNWALWFKHMLGAVATTGAGPYTHTCTPGDLRGRGLTLQLGLDDSAGVAQPFTYNGAKVTGWELSCSAPDGLAMVTVSLVAKAETTATALAVPNYTASNNLFSFVHGAITIGGGAASVKEATVTADNALNTERFYIGQDTTSEPLEKGYRTYTGSLTCDFENLTAYNRFVNGTEAALDLTFTRGADSIKVAGNVRFDGETPEVTDDITEQALPIKFLSPNTTDAAAITVTVVSGEATP